MTPSTSPIDHPVVRACASSSEPTDHLVFHDRVPVGLAIGWAAVAFAAAILAMAPLYVAVPTLTASALAVVVISRRRARPQTRAATGDAHAAHPDARVDRDTAVDATPDEHAHTS